MIFVRAGDTMCARGWRGAGGTLGAALAVVLVVTSTPTRAQEQEGAQETARQTTTEQEARAAEESQQPASGQDAAAAQPDRQQAAQRPAPGSKVPPPTGSLAAAAARIHLRRPPDEGQGPVVISNQNLDDVAAEGTVSEGGGVGSSAVAGAEAGGKTGEAAVNSASDLVSQYLEQKRTVDGLEARLKNFDEQLAKPATDPHYAQSQNSPQFRAPGVVDNAQTQRDDVAKQLAEERAKLDALRARAAREGVDLAGPTKPAPSPSP